MKVVIAEKPSVGRELAKVLGASQVKDGFIEGEGIAFTWAFGHLVQLAFPEDYGFKEWSKENLPMIPSQFQLVQKKIKSARALKDDPGAKKQLKVIDSLFKRASEIIVATDAGREGELIFRFIYEYLGCTKPFQRLWISSQTDKAIRDGFAKLRNGRDFDNLADASYSRSQADWLIGMNATQALSVSVGKGLYSVGRVQTPTLAMVCERFLDNKYFKPEIYFQLTLNLEKDGIKFTAVSSSKFESKTKADESVTLIRKIGLAHVQSVSTKQKIEPAPLLYDLTTLQQDANRKFGLSADKTLQIAQKLYESKLITYPRTGSRYIGPDVFDLVPGLISLLTKYQPLQRAASAMTGKLNSRSVNAEKVTDHHALLPTENLPSNLSGEQKCIYELIAGRMLEAFSDACVKVVTTIGLSAKEEFIAHGTVISQPGWRSVWNDLEILEEDDNSKLPVVTEGENLRILDVKSVEKTTRPKPLHTEASLLKAMETCGKDIEDDAAKDAMKDAGLGTPATRAAIIETLFSRDYIVRQKKNLVPTEKGLAVYHITKDKPIASPELTGEWESKLLSIERGQLSAHTFMNEIKTYTKDITNELLNTGYEHKTTQTKMENANEHDCPKCKSAKLKFVDNPKLQALVCTAPREDCGFILFREIARKKLSDAQLIDLITKGKTDLIKGFTSKSGNKFDASLKLDESWKIAFVF